MARPVVQRVSREDLLVFIERELPRAESVEPLARRERWNSQRFITERAALTWSIFFELRDDTDVRRAECPEEVFDCLL
jgi:hypothetical protein